MRTRTIRFVGIAALAGAAMLMSTLSPASARLLRPIVLGRGAHYAGIQPPPVTLGIETPSLGVETPGNMTYLGGPVMRSPKAYIVFWGWGGAGHDANNVDDLLIRFFGDIGGSAWQAVTTQYSDTTGPIANPANQLAGWWYDDTSPIHDGLSSADYAAEAARAVAHIGGAPDANTNYIVATPHNFNDAGFNASSYCAYHDYASGIAYTVLPYIPNAGSNCGAGLVNTPGTLDGVTMVAGHEYLEAVTDPIVGTGWLDTIGNENADKCAYVTFGPGTVSNVALAHGTYPVQSTWSNTALSGLGSCAP